MRNVFMALMAFSSLHAFALDPTQFTVQRITSPYFVVDGNSPTSGPQTAYVGFKITNISGTTSFSNLKFTINSIGTSVVGQNYTMVSPASGITLVGTLAPGASKVCYFYITYPANVTPQATFNYTLSDATATSKTGSFVIANRSSISANAGGLATQNISNQDLIGGIVYDDITYTLGNIRTGDENDFQVSVSTQFDPTKLVLLKTQVVSSTVPGITAGTNDLLYFTTTANQSSGTVTIRWTFKISSYNFTALVLPYAGATSGASNYKYAISTDLGGGTPITISSSANPLLISKTSDKTLYGVTTTAIFTVTIQNPGAYDVSIDKITDAVPTGFKFLALDGSSGVTTSNSTTYPSTNATGAITFEGGVVSGANTSYIVPATGSLILKYSATTSSTTASNLTTTAAGFIGTTQFGSAQNTVNVSATLPVVIQSLKANQVNGKTKLDWTTSSEVNSAFFEVERSNDGMRFLKIGMVTAYNTPSVTQNYSFTDEQNFNAIVYYRLRSVDQDGNSKYSDIVSLKMDSNVPVIVIGNSFSNHFQVSVSVVQNQHVKLNLFDDKGAVLVQKQQSCNAGINIIQVQSANLPKGIYFLQTIVDGKNFVSKLIKN